MRKATEVKKLRSRACTHTPAKSRNSRIRLRSAQEKCVAAVEFADLDIGRDIHTADINHTYLFNSPGRGDLKGNIPAMLDYYRAALANPELDRASFANYIPLADVLLAESMAGQLEH